MNHISELLRLEDITVVDVRTPAEFNEGHLAGSINIPLNEIISRLDELKSGRQILLCCASGIRSKKATDLLKENSVDCQDGGSWLDLKNQLNINGK